MKKKLLISFSGGRTSAYMLWWLLNVWEDRDNWEMIIVFANTGKEHAETLLFVHRIAWKWNINIIWVEAKHKDENGVPYSAKGWAVKHKIVDYFTASRKGEPFEEMISLLGIPSTNAPFCSKQLKKFAIESYLKSIGWSDYHTAIGIRIDEVDRVNETWKDNNLMYPLIQHNPSTKQVVVIWWSKQEFDLNVPEGLGNCDNCWKKDIGTLTNNVKRYPKTFDWWQEMTDKYGHLNPRNSELKPPFNFYRGNISPKDIFELARLSPDQLSLFAEQEKLDGCSESCEPFN
mgnify:CR=1 FL=1